MERRDRFGPRWNGANFGLHVLNPSAPFVERMMKHSEQSEIEELFRRLSVAHADRDADAIARLYAPGALIYDMAPPLGRRGIDRDLTAEWLATWEGPLRIDAQDVEMNIDADVAFATALTRMRGHKEGKDQDIWFRSTLDLRKIEGHWRIVHEHASVPFYMDGSERAALDLVP